MMLWRTLLICFSLLSLAACEKKHDGEDQPLVVITSPDSPPFEFKDTARGGDQVIGFDIDVVRMLGDHLGRPIKIVEADFSALIPSLQAGRADMAIAYLSATEERRKSVDFSAPYYTTKLALLLPEASEVETEKDLDGKKLGVQLGSANEAIAQKWAQNSPRITVVSLNKIGDLVQELKNGRLQAVLMEDIVAQKIVHSNPGIKVMGLSYPGDALAIAFPKGSPWVEPTNKALKLMKGDIEKLAKKWFDQ